MPDGYYQYEKDGIKHFTDQQPNVNLNAVYTPSRQPQSRTIDPVQIGIERAGGIDPNTYDPQAAADNEFSQKQGLLFQHIFGRDGSPNQLTGDELKYWNQQSAMYKNQLIKKHSNILARSKQIVDSTVKSFQDARKEQMAQEDKAMGHIMKMKPTAESLKKAAPDYFAKRGINLSEVISKEKAEGAKGYKETEYNAALDDLRKMYKTPSGMLGNLMFDSEAARKKALRAEEQFNLWSKEKNKDGSPKYSPHELIWMADNYVKGIEERYFNIMKRDDVKNDPKAIEKINKFFKENYHYVPELQPIRK